MAAYEDNAKPTRFKLYHMNFRTDKAIPIDTD